MPASLEGQLVVALSSRALIMDILKFGADVEVLAPPDLRQRVADEAARMTQMYVAAPRAARTAKPKQA